jgi:hypothetical protein
MGVMTVQEVGKGCKPKEVTFVGALSPGDGNPGLYATSAPVQDRVLVNGQRVKLKGPETRSP